VFFYYLFLDLKNSQLITEYKIEQNISTIIIGDSHTQLGINDSLIPNGLNISQSGEAYIFSHSKLKVILQNNPKINKVILGFSYHNISTYYDEYIYGNPSKSPLSDYFFILPFEHKYLLLKKNWRTIFFNFNKILKIGFENTILKSKKYSFIGYYSPSKPDALLDSLSVSKRISFQYYKKTQLQNFSIIQIVYLKKIIELCKQKDIELMLISTPLSISYSECVPLKFKLKFDSIINETNALLIDVKEIQFENNLFLQDGEHLTDSGANIISNYLLINDLGNQ